MNSVWLVDADNQSPVLAETTAHLLGWPSRVVLAGLGGNLRSWQERANIPEDVQVDVWESPAIPDGADVLLAMAAGCLIQTLERAVIFSRDGLVAGTLGRLLHARGIKVLAVSAMDHPGLPYPHLTLPLPSGQKMAAPVIPAPVPTGGITEEYANQVFDGVFLALGNPESVNRANFHNHLNQRGYNAERRGELQRLATGFCETGSGTDRSVVRVASF
jgi:hypothetical protein